MTNRNKPILQLILHWMECDLQRLIHDAFLGTLSIVMLIFNVLFPLVEKPMAFSLEYLVRLPAFSAFHVIEVNPLVVNFNRFKNLNIIIIRYRVQIQTDLRK